MLLWHLLSIAMGHKYLCGMHLALHSWLSSDKEEDLLSWLMVGHCRCYGRYFVEVQDSFFPTLLSYHQFVSCFEIKKSLSITGDICELMGLWLLFRGKFFRTSDASSAKDLSTLIICSMYVNLNHDQDNVIFDRLK